MSNPVVAQAVIKGFLNPVSYSIPFTIHRQHKVLGRNVAIISPIWGHACTMAPSGAMVMYWCSIVVNDAHQLHNPQSTQTHSITTELI